MYENFLLSSQHELYLFLSKADEIVNCLRFRSYIHKYGAPNDEARGGHPLAKFGLGFYGIYEIQNSPWLVQMMKQNRVHPRHNDAMFFGYVHIAVCFKDVLLEVLCREWEELEMPVAEIEGLLAQQLLELE